MRSAMTTQPCRRWPVIWASPGTPPGRRSRPKQRPGSPGPNGLRDVKALGVDEHIWRPSRVGTDRAVTIMVDLTRDQDGCLHARLLDAVVGRSGTAYKTWLQAQPDGFTATVEQAALDPFRGYANAIRDELPDAVAGTGRLPCGPVGHPGRRRGPPPRPTRHPWPSRPQDTIRSTRSAASSATVSSTCPNGSRPSSPGA